MPYTYPEIRLGVIKMGDGNDANYVQVYETRYDDLNWERWSIFGIEETTDGGETWSIGGPSADPEDMVNE